MTCCPDQLRVAATRANGVLERGLEMLKEQCSDEPAAGLRLRAAVSTPASVALPPSSASNNGEAPSSLAAAPTSGAACSAGTPLTRPSPGAVACPVGTPAVPGSSSGTGSLNATPRSALTTAFTLMRQTSADLAAEAAAVAEALAAALVAEHEETLAALGLAQGFTATATAPAQGG